MIGFGYVDIDSGLGKIEKLVASCDVVVVTTSLEMPGSGRRGKDEREL